MGKGGGLWMGKNGWVKGGKKRGGLRVGKGKELRVV